MKRRSLVRVEDVMVEEFDVVDGIATIADVLGKLKYPNNECAIVNRRNEDDEYGILLLSDIAKFVLVATDRAPDRVNVYEIMTKPVIAVNPRMDIRYCARLFHKFGLTRAPVMKGREILGVVGFKEIVLKGQIAQSSV